MLFQVIEENGQKKIQPLTADAGAGAPVGTVIELPVNQCPTGYLPMGQQYDETMYPVLYAMLGTNVTPYKKSPLTKADPVQLAWTTPNTAYYADDDGELIVSTNTGRIDIYINEVRCGMAVDRQVTAFELKKGDKILFDNVGDTGSIYLVYFRRYTAYCFIKATSGLSENAQDNVINTLNEQRSYSTEEHLTGAKWIDGKPIYRKCYDAGSFVSNIDWDVSSLNIDVLINAQVIGCNSADGTSTRWTMSLASGFDSRQAYLSLGHFLTTGDYYKRYAIIEYTKTTD